MKLEIELDVPADAVEKARLEKHLREEAVLTLFAEGRIPGGKAARELSVDRVEFMEILKQRGIPYVVYTVDDWDADAKSIELFEQRRKAG
jgi:predicted HTH domain antitoxin